MPIAVIANRAESTLQLPLGPAASASKRLGLF